MFSFESWRLLLQLGHVNVLQLLIKKDHFFQQSKLLQFRSSIPWRKKTELDPDMVRSKTNADYNTKKANV
jgi:hypothetical protein